MSFTDNPKTIEQIFATSPVPLIYDIHVDNFRPVTQQDVEDFGVLKSRYVAVKRLYENACELNDKMRAMLIELGAGDRIPNSTIAHTP